MQFLKNKDKNIKTSIELTYAKSKVDGNKWISLKKSDYESKKEIVDDNRSPHELIVEYIKGIKFKKTGKNVFVFTVNITKK